MDDYLERTAVQGISGLPTGNEDRTIFLVAQFHNANAFGGVAWGEGAPNQTFGVGTQNSRNANGRAMVQGWGRGNDFFGSELVYTPPTGPTTGWTILTAVHRGDRASENVLLYKDGNLIGSFDHQYNTDLGDAASRLVIGEEIGGAGNIRMDVAAIQIYDDDLDLGEIRAIESELSTKYLSASGNNGNGNNGGSANSLLASTQFSTWATSDSSVSATVNGDVNFQFDVGNTSGPLAMLRSSFNNPVAVGNSSFLDFTFEMSVDYPLVTIGINDANGNWHFHREADIVAQAANVVSIPYSTLAADVDPSQLGGFDILLFSPGIAGELTLEDVGVSSPSAARALVVDLPDNPSDLSGDGRSSIEDFLLFSSAFRGEAPELVTRADLSSDGSLDLADFMIFHRNFQATVPVEETVEVDEIFAALDEYFALDADDNDEIVELLAKP